MRSIRWIKVKLQKTIKPNISNKSKNILGIDRAVVSSRSQWQERVNTEQFSLQTCLKNSEWLNRGHVLRKTVRKTIGGDSKSANSRQQ